jgi:hypothetical protein
MATGINVSRCIHGLTLTILAPDPTIVTELVAALPCGCTINGSGIIRAEPERAPVPTPRAPKPSMFNRGTKPADFTSKGSRAS